MRVDSPTYETEKYGEADLLHATAVPAEDGSVTVFAVNRSRTQRVTLHQVSGTTLSDGALSAVLEPLSWNVIRLG